MRVSRSFNGGPVVQREEGKDSECLDPFIPDAVEPCSYGFLRLAPYRNGVVKIKRLCLDPVN